MTYIYFTLLYCWLAITLSRSVLADESEWEASSIQEHLSEHRINQRNTHVSFRDVNLKGDPETVAWNAIAELTTDLHNRISGLYENAVTKECRALIGEHYGYFLKAIATENPIPFADIKFNNTCIGDKEWDFANLPEGVHMGHIQNRTYQPPRNETEYISSSEIVICYGILAHDDASATIRFIEAVDEPTTQFVVHIDAKYEDTYLTMKEYASTRSKVTVLDHSQRVRVNWGGFSMVNATLQVLNVADQLDFTHFIHMASTAYPIASNRRIRNTLAAFPKDANFLHIIMKPNRPGHSVWNYFVECDDRLHRIYRLTPIQKETHGADFYTSSQWFIISKEFAHYLANPEPGSFVAQYLEYVEHAVVADESFFGTVLRNTHFCHKHHNWNFLHLQFDQWENERSLELRDERKCVMPDPNHCGRSPTTMTMDYLDMLELSGDLFARKFLDHVDSKIKDVIDSLRLKEEFQLTSLNISEPKENGAPKVDMSLDGLGTLFVAKDTINASMPMCMGLGPERNKVRIVPCFHDWVPQTLAPGWETGAVILEETLLHNRWEIEPCSSDGNLKRLDTAEVEVTPGSFSPTGPRCMIYQVDGLRAGRCLDGESLDVQPGGPVHVYPCTKRWHQFLSFGTGKETPKGSLFTTVPLHTRRRIAETGREQEAYMCLGVAGRGELDEEDWLGVRDEGEEEEEESTEEENDDTEIETETIDQIDQDNFSVDGDEMEGEDGLLPFSHWEGEQLVATRCSNVGAVIEWVLVPFIEEDDEENDEESVDESAGEEKSEQHDDDEEL